MTPITTVDHARIRDWVKSRKGHPAMAHTQTIMGPASKLLRIDFAGWPTDPCFHSISWEEFFESFENAKLAFVYRGMKESGEPSHFCEFTARQPVADF
jgi:hypothetical protein